MKTKKMENVREVTAKGKVDRHGDMQEERKKADRQSLISKGYPRQMGRMQETNEEIES